MPLEARPRGVVKPQDLNPDYFNKQGKIRLARVQALNEVEKITPQELANVYSAWVDHDEGFVLQRMNPLTFETEKIGVKCSKRGNDVYRWRIRKRFGELEGIIDKNEIEFFNKQDLKPMTKCLFVTFTYDVKRSSKAEAWRNVGNEFNKALARLRKRYGGLSCFRAWEAFDNGYPHIHAILLFREQEFNVFYDRANHPRVDEKHDLESSWHSFIDVEAVQDLGKSMSYLVKYLSKVHHRTEAKHTTTLSNMWLYNKRAFGLSGEFLRDLKAYRLDYIMCNSNPKIVQVDLNGEIVNEGEWKFVGFTAWQDIEACRREKLDKGLWHYDLEKIPKSCLESSGKSDGYEDYLEDMQGGYGA